MAAARRAGGPDAVEDAGSAWEPAWEPAPSDRVGCRSSGHTSAREGYPHTCRASRRPIALADPATGRSDPAIEAGRRASYLRVGVAFTTGVACSLQDRSGGPHGEGGHRRR